MVFIPVFSFDFHQAHFLLSILWSGGSQPTSQVREDLPFQFRLESWEPLSFPDRAHGTPPPTLAAGLGIVVGQEH